MLLQFWEIKRKRLRMICLGQRRVRIQEWGEGVILLEQLMGLIQTQILGILRLICLLKIYLICFLVLIIEVRTVKFLNLLGPRPAFRTDGPQFSRNTSNRSSGRDRRTPEFTHVNRSGSYLQLLPVFFLLLFTMISWISGGIFIFFLFLKGLEVLNFLLQSLMLTLMRHIQKNMMLNSLLIRGNIIPSINIISKD